MRKSWAKLWLSPENWSDSVRFSHTRASFLVSGIAPFSKKDETFDLRADTNIIFWTRRARLLTLAAYWRLRSPTRSFRLSPIIERRNPHWSSLPGELRWLATHLRPLVRWHAASFLCLTAGSGLGLLTPLILKWLIDAIIPQGKMGLLLLAVLLIFLGHQGRSSLTSLGSYLMLTAALKLGLSLRLSLLRHLDTLSADYYEATPVGTVMYPLKEPIEEISYFGSDLLPAVLRMLLTAGMTLTTMFVLSPVLTLTVVPLIPVFLITRHYFRTKLAANADAVQSSQVVWSNFLEEHLASITSIQLLAQEKRQERRAFCFLARAVRSQQRFYKTGTGFTMSSSLAVALALCAVIGYGGRQVLIGSLSMGSLVAFYGFITQLFDPLTGASELYARAQKVFASIRQIQAALGLAPSVCNRSPAVSLTQEHRPEIEMVAVEFGYRKQRNLLHTPLLRISPGEHVAIAGENGAGKSTLAKLIARVYDPVSGVVRVGGEDLRALDLTSLRRYVCYLPRDPVFFDGTILYNLRFVRPAASDDQIQDAIQAAALAGLIDSLPKGLRQRIGPDGCQLSGGERQRLAIARAFLQQPRILILDESTSCLDPAAERIVLENLRRKLSHTTLIVVSHRVSTWNSFPRVLMLSRGRMMSDVDRKSFLAAQAVETEHSISTAPSW